MLFTGGSRGPPRRPPFAPKIFFKIVHFSGNFKGKPPVLSKLWAQGSKLQWPPWQKSWICPRSFTYWVDSVGKLHHWFAHCEPGRNIIHLCVASKAGCWHFRFQMGDEIKKRKKERAAQFIQIKEKETYSFCSKFENEVYNSAVKLIFISFFWGGGRKSKKECGQRCWFQKIFAASDNWLEKSQSKQQPTKTDTIPRIKWMSSAIQCGALRYRGGQAGLHRTPQKRSLQEQSAQCLNFHLKERLFAERGFWGGDNFWHTAVCWSCLTDRSVQDETREALKWLTQAPERIFTVCSGSNSRRRFWPVDLFRTSVFARPPGGWVWPQLRGERYPLTSVGTTVAGYQRCAHPVSRCCPTRFCSTSPHQCRHPVDWTPAMRKEQSANNPKGQNNFSALVATQEGKANNRLYNRIWKIQCTKGWHCSRILQNIEAFPKISLQRWKP